MFRLATSVALLYALTFVILFELCTTSSPFHAPDPLQTSIQQTAGGYPDGQFGNERTLLGGYGKHRRAVLLKALYG
ncbi:unnamed protein product [Anisakis simplex]|uniref:Secreted protein n=1 Tax=Anisakis simplex TaxID=6269 RepID=A0A0M3J985_ANISI|nr:unnamed protein product [Anisakis simplex]